MAEGKNEGTPASVWLVAIGILVGVIGWMLTMGPADGPSGFRDTGGGLVTLGEVLFGLGILIEFFSIGSSLRKIASQVSDRDRSIVHYHAEPQALDPPLQQHE